jgi:glutaredoxin
MRTVLLFSVLTFLCFSSASMAQQVTIDGIPIRVEVVKSAPGIAPVADRNPDNQAKSQQPVEQSSAQTVQASAPSAIPVIYGGKACPITKKYLKELKEAKLDYVYKDLDDSTIMDEASTKLTAQGVQGSVQTPLVEIDGKLMVRPGLAVLLKPAFKNQAQYNQITIYSTKTDRISEQFMKNLSALGVPFVFKDSSQPDVNRDLFKRLGAQHVTNSVQLPVVMVNDKLHIQPDLMEIVNLAKK